MKRSLCYRPKILSSFTIYTTISRWAENATNTNDVTRSIFSACFPSVLGRFSRTYRVFLREHGTCNDRNEYSDYNDGYLRLLAWRVSYAIVRVNRNDNWKSKRTNKWPSTRTRSARVAFRRVTKWPTSIISLDNLVNPGKSFQIDSSVSRRILPRQSVVQFCRRFA